MRTLPFPVPVISLLLVAALLFAAGCTDEAPPPPENAPQEILPGQTLMLVGDVTGDSITSGTLSTVSFRLGLVPGQKPVEMDKLTIIYADTINTATLKYVPVFNGTAGRGSGRGEWSITGVENQIGYPDLKIENNEVFEIIVNPRTFLPPGRMVEIVVRPPGGATPVTIRRFVPPSIGPRDNILTTS